MKHMINASDELDHRIGMLLLVSGPSGSGKTTLCRRAADDKLASYATSCTTREAREGEEDGVDYFFMSKEEFQQKIAANELLEHAEVHGNYYGTLKSEVIAHLREGGDVVMDIDVQGAESIRHCNDELIQRALVQLFVMPPCEKELRKRLTARGTDNKEIIEQRMVNALEEMEQWDKYTYCLISEDKESDYKKFTALLTAESLRSNRIVSFKITI